MQARYLHTLTCGRQADEMTISSRTQLAVVYYNENSTKVQAETADGERWWKVKTSKARRGHNVCPVKEETTYSYVDNVLLNVVESCEGSSYKESFLSNEPPTLHHMTSHYNRPEKQELISARHSRLSKTLPDPLSLPALPSASSS
ncbi:hypothetical protein V5799_014763 [Amblyomma americanum]|uniref:Uncharacterized protein n=1 Tax=Amblyomma americanum TaxID=6943 RepID=A0AAQ4E234_AMBAM